MLYLFYFIITIELFTVFYNIFKFIIFKINGKQFSTNGTPSSEPFQINILIPCYKEINVIEHTLDHFNNITKNFKNIDIYVITTEKEKCENNVSLTTYEYLSGLDIAKLGNIHIINYPKTYGIMADQLNYGIKQILSNSKVPNDKIYFSIYNADSNPDDSTFIELSKKISKNNFPIILQQYSNYFLNHTKQNFLMKGFSIYQTAFEFRNGLINNSSKFLYSHVVGHGLTIRADYITKIKGFNSDVWCEDIYLTGLLFNNSVKIISLESLDNAENPEKFSVQIVQNAVWFKTASHHFKLLKLMKKNYKITLYGFLWLLHELRASLVWALMPLFLLYSFIYPVFIKNYSLLMISICSYLIFVFVNYLANLIVVDKKRFGKYLKNYFSLALAILFTGIGPVYSLFLKEKVKTPRS